MKMIDIMQKWGLSVVFIILLIISFVYNTTSQPAEFSTKGTKIITFPVEEGWGYEIQVSGKTLIVQEFMPAMEGRTPFYSEDSAKVIGNWVCKQLESHHSPTVSRYILDSLLTTNFPK